MRFDRSLIEAHLPATGISEVAHYTRIGTVAHFLPDGATEWSSARATPVQFLNDRKELTLGLEVIEGVASTSFKRNKKIRTVIDALLTSSGAATTDVFQMSFSGNPDELGQWRGYGSNGMGCCVVTDAIEVSRAADVAGWILYDRPDQDTFAHEVIRGVARRSPNVIERALLSCACFMKHEGFRPEVEFRLVIFPKLTDIQFRESGDRLVPFVDYLQKSKRSLPLRKVIIGPGWQLANLSSVEFAKNHVVQGIRRLLELRGLKRTDVEVSRIPYDPR